MTWYRNLFEQNGSRITDFRRVQSLGTRDHIVHWPKPATRPQWMTPEQSGDAPDAITLREVKVARQVLVTTLLDHQRVSKGDLSALYGRRWNVELDLRTPPLRASESLSPRSSVNIR
jgi:IS4 transposase